MLEEQRVLGTDRLAVQLVIRIAIQNVGQTHRQRGDEQDHPAALFPTSESPFHPPTRGGKDQRRRGHRQYTQDR